MVEQQIPIVNNSATEWKVSAVISEQKGGQLFSFSKDGSNITNIKKDIKRGTTDNITLYFKPQWKCIVSAVMTLKNETTKEEYEYELKGDVDGPLCVDHIILNCRARETKYHNFEIKNQSDKPVTYTVYTDLSNAVGTKEFIVKPKSSYDYKLAVTPLLGGTTTAQITMYFSEPGSSEERFIWWTVEVRTDSPVPQSTIDLRSFIRKAA